MGRLRPVLLPDGSWEVCLLLYDREGAEINASKEKNFGKISRISKKPVRFNSYRSPELQKNLSNKVFLSSLKEGL